MEIHSAHRSRKGMSRGTQAKTNSLRREARRQCCRMSSTSAQFRWLICFRNITSLSLLMMIMKMPISIKKSKRLQPLQHVESSQREASHKQKRQSVHIWTKCATCIAFLNSNQCLGHGETPGPTSISSWPVQARKILNITDSAIRTASAKTS